MPHALQQGDQDLNLDKPFRHGKRFDTDPSTCTNWPFVAKYVSACLEDRRNEVWSMPDHVDLHLQHVFKLRLHGREGDEDILEALPRLGRVIVSADELT